MPLLDLKPGSTSVHWSKDYVEHLRTVHLTLVAVSVAILIVVWSAKSYNPSVASRQIHQILELKKLWSPQWVRSNGHHDTIKFGRQPDASGHVRDERSNTIEVGDWLYMSIDAKLQGIKVNLSSNPTKIIDKRKLASQTRNVLLIFPTQNFSDKPSRHNILRATVFPGSLSDYEEWWNDLAEPEELYFPTSIARHTDNVVIDTWGFVPVYNSINETDGPIIQLRLLTKDSNEHVDLSKAEYFGVASPTILNIPSPTEILFYIPTQDHVTFGRDSLTQFFGNWRPYDFAHSFSDLHGAARDFGSLELEDVEKILDTEAAKGGEVFEIVGLKIPVEQVTTWGSIVLIGVQVYLLLFLRQLKGKLRPEDPGWDVPWVGMDQTNFAQFMFFLTVVLLPCFGAAALGVRAAWSMTADYRDPEHFWKLTVGLEHGSFIGVVVAVLIAAFAVTCILAAKCWECRPKVVASGLPEPMGGILLGTGANRANPDEPQCVIPAGSGSCKDVGHGESSARVGGSEQADTEL